MKKFCRFLLIVLLGFTTACGYHLRGSIALPAELKNVYMFGMSGALSEEMKSLLRAADSKVAASPNQAGIVIKVLKEDMRNRVTSLGQTGKSNEMELNYYLRFQFYDNQENPLMDEQTIELNREFFNDQTVILAKENEEQTIRKEIYRQAARSIMSRAEIAIGSKKK